MSTAETANRLIECGMSVIPIQMPSKVPTVKAWHQFQQHPPAPGELTFNGGMAMICGKAYNLECLDIDLKYDMTGTLLQRFQDALGELWEHLEPLILIQQTVKGGVHLVYRCKEVGNNEKLASRPTTEAEKALNPGEKCKVLLETRGEGGYFVISPTPGYEVLQGSFENIGWITPDQRRQLLDAAKSLNEYWEEVSVRPTRKVQEAAGGLRSWEDYDRKADVAALLEKHGWTYVRSNARQQFWKRPGSTDSLWSASYHPELNLFYVYSSSVADLSAGKAYTPSALLAHLEFKGDFESMARDLFRLGYGDHTKTPQKPSNQPNLPGGSPVSLAPAQRNQPTDAPDQEAMKAIWREVLVTSEPPEDVVLLQIQNVPVATLGNHSLLIGKKKSRKTLFISWLISQYQGQIDTDIMLFDTEQGRRHVWRLREKIYQLTGVYIPTFYLRGKSLEERRQIIDGTLKHWPTRPRIIIIDGIRDLISNINDPDQSTDLILWLERLILSYNIHVVNVLHINKTDNNARGHIGSELLNKAEITIELEKDEASGSTIVKCESSRDKPFEDFSFTHGDDDLPVLCSLPVRGQVLPESERRIRLQAAFDGRMLKYSEAVEEIKAQFGVGRDKARTLIAEFHRKGWLIKVGATEGKNSNQNVTYKLMI